MIVDVSACLELPMGARGGGLRGEPGSYGEDEESDDFLEKVHV